MNYIYTLCALGRNLSLKSAAGGVNAASHCFPLKLLQDHGPGHIKILHPFEFIIRVSRKVC